MINEKKVDAFDVKPELMKFVIDSVSLLAKHLAQPLDVSRAQVGQSGERPKGGSL